jgi:hypothetical protein
MSVQVRNKGGVIWRHLYSIIEILLNLYLKSVSSLKIEIIFSFDAPSFLSSLILSNILGQI